ncbi:urea carboxylase-associated protein 1 [Alicyclobacillus hesperidum URH17-3-68]|nr:urea carboxylase-associated protein 1 [Alicyclobacillus hesperidum URH17-3-68]
MVAFPVPLSIALLYAVSSGTGFDAARTFDPYAVTTSAAAVENIATNKPLAT